MHFVNKALRRLKQLNIMRVRMDIAGKTSSWQAPLLHEVMLLLLLLVCVRIFHMAQLCCSWMDLLGRHLCCETCFGHVKSACSAAVCPAVRLSYSSDYNTGCCLLLLFVILRKGYRVWFLCNTCTYRCNAAADVCIVAPQNDCVVVLGTV